MNRCLFVADARAQPGVERDGRRAQPVERLLTGLGDF
jgi:hypothetical protein